MSTFEHQHLINQISTHLAPFRRSQTDTMTGFAQLSKAAMATGSIDAKTKELIALAIGITQHCSGCIGFHVKALIKMGCTKQELEEMLGVCVYMGGGPALMYASEAIAAFDAMSANTSTSV